MIISKNDSNTIEIKEFYKTGSNTINSIEFSDSSSLSLKDIVSKTLLFVSDLDDDIKVVTDDSYEIDALGGDDTIETLGGNDIINGNDGNDKIYSGSGNDTIIGGSGNDIIDSGSGDDILIGGYGDDILKGEGGNDTYKFDKNFGKDIIIDNLGDDSIEFNSNISNLVFTQLLNKDLLVSDGNSNTVTIKEFFKLNEDGKRASSINSISCSGKTLNLKEITDLCLKNTSSKDDNLFVITDDDYSVKLNDGNDKIVMLDGDDYIDGGDGDDEIFAGGGDDIIIPGKGDDYINTGKGKNKVIFESNFGNDILNSNELDEIIFKGIDKNSLSFNYDEKQKDLIINHNFNTLTIKNFGTKESSIDKIVFDNKDILDKRAIIELSNILSSDDTLIINGSGEFNAGMGNDTYVITNQTKKAIINDNFELYKASKDSGKDTVEFKDIKNKEDLEFDIVKNNLLITIKDKEHTLVVIENFFDKNKSIEYIKVNDEMMDLKDIVFNKFKPTISTDSFRLDEDSTLNGSIVVNNPLNSTLTYEIVKNSDNASFTMDNNSFTFMPDKDFNGVSSIFIKVSNEYGMSDTKEIKFIVDSINDTPSLLNNQTDIKLKDKKLFTSTLTVKDIDSNTFKFSVKSTPKFGKFMIDDDGNYTYTPDKGYLGDDAVVVMVSDEGGLSDTITLNFNIDASKPIIKTDILNLDEDTPLISNLIITNESNSDLTYEIINNPTNGKFLLDKNGSFKYNPNLNYNGKDSITIKVTNEYGLSHTKQIDIDINPINDAPTLLESSSTYDLKNTNTINSSINANDIDKDNLTYKIISNPNSASITIDKDGNFKYKAKDNFIGKDRILVEVSDGEASIVKELIFNNLGYKIDDKDTNITIDPNDKIDNTIDLSIYDKDDLEFNKNSNNLEIKIKNTIITLREYFTTEHSIKGIKFSDAYIDISNDLLSTPNKQWWQIHPQAKLDKKGNIVSYSDNTLLYGSNENDTIISLNKNTNIKSYNGDDFIYTSSNNNIIDSGNGNDIIISKGSDDKIYSYDGDDYILAGLNAYINSGTGDDIITLTGNNSKAYLDNGDDKAFINSQDSLVDGGNGSDTLISNNISNTFIGGNGNDTFIINSNSNNTIIKDKEYVNLVDGGDDRLIIKDANKVDISFKFTGAFNKDLTISYKTKDTNQTKTILLQNQSNKNSSIETISLDDGSFITNNQINKVIQDLNSYANDNGINLNNQDDFTTNPDIMQIYINAWQK